MRKGNKMQVQRIQNNNYNPQFKGYIRLVSPTGERLTVKPEQIQEIYSKTKSFYCRRNGSYNYYYYLLKHVIKMTRVALASKSSFMVNATDKDVFNAMKVAKKKPDTEIIEVGNPLPYLKAICDGKDYDRLPTYSVQQLKNIRNTQAVYSHGDTKDYFDVDFQVKYVVNGHTDAGDYYLAYMRRVIECMN